MSLPEPSATPPTTTAKLPEKVDAYCMKCKQNREMTEAQLVTTKNGRPAAKGKCPTCGTTMTKFLPTK